MTSEEKARYEELEAKDCLIDDEDVIDYYRLRCEILEEENQELKKIIQKLLNGLNNIVECKPKEIRGFILLLIEDFEDRLKEVLGNE